MSTWSVSACLLDLSAKNTFVHCLKCRNLLLSVNLILHCYFYVSLLDFVLAKFNLVPITNIH